MNMAPWQRWLLILLEAALALVGLGLGRLLHVQSLASLGLTPAAVLWGLVATVPMLMVAAAIGRYHNRFTCPLIRIIDELIVPTFRDWTIAQMALAGLCAGLGEEILFRGALQAAAMETYGPAIGLVAASLAFGLVHSINFSYALFATLVGIYLGWLWLATGNLLAPTIAHGLYDFLALVYLTRVRSVSGVCSSVDAGGN
jgi:uncharacterized protein